MPFLENHSGLRFKMNGNQLANIEHLEADLWDAADIQTEWDAELKQLSCRSRS